MERSGHVPTVLIVGEFKYPIYQEACARALEELGVEVIRFATKEFFPSGMAGRMQRRFAFGPAVGRLNRDLLSEVERHRPEVVWIYNSPYVLPKALERLRESALLVGFTNDNPFGENAQQTRWRRFRETIPYFDLWHVYRPENIEDFEKAGARDVRLLMSYYLPWEVTPECRTPRDQFEYDITFVGHCEKDDRLEYVESILEAGLNLRLFGNPVYWKRYLPKKYVSALPEIVPLGREDYRRVVRTSKINLCFLSGLNRDEYTRRCFEIPAWGGFLLSKRTDLLKGLYQEGSEAEFFSSPDELVEKCKYYLKNEKDRETIAARGQARCLGEDRDVVSRMRQWLQEVEQLRRQAEDDRGASR